MITKNKETALIAGTMFAFGVSGACSIALGSLIPFLRSTYGLSYDFAGLLVSAQSVGNLAATGLMGFLPALLGRRKAVLSTAVWMAAAYLLFTTGWGGAGLLAGACFVMGIAKGGNISFANTMMSTLPGKKAGIGYNLAHGSYAVGALLSPLLIVACASAGPSGWRITTAVLLGLCLLQLLDYCLLPLPQENTQRSVRSIDRSFLKSRSFYLASAILFFYVSTEYAINGWLVTYFQDIGVLSGAASQLMSSLLWLVMFTGRMIGAVLVGKVSGRKLLLADGLGLLAFFLLVFFSRTPALIYIGIAGVGLSMATIYTCAMSLGTRSVRGNDLGISAMILAGSIGGILTPAAVGFVAERAGMQAGMGVVVAATVLLLATISFSCLGTKEETE